MIKAGFYECDITPPLGTERPADFYKLVVEKISDPLKVRAAVFTDGTIKIAFVGIDNIGCGEAFRKRVEELLPEFSLIISASHTHYGGNLRDKIRGIDEAPEEIRSMALDNKVVYDPDYYAFCLKQFVTAVKMAAMDLKEVEFSFGKGRIENLIFNRRIRMKDGSVQTHPGKGNPDAVDYAGPVDNELGVVGIWEKGADRLIGCMLNFSCHACINLEGASADFPGVAINTVRGVYGQNIGAVYINGASGDVTQVNNLSLQRDRGRGIADKIGRVVGAKAIELLATAPRGEISCLRYISECIPLQKVLPTSKQLEQSWKIVHEQPDSPAALLAKTKIVQHYFSTKYPSVPTEKLCVAQIGPLVIGSSSGEMFAQYALDFKAASQFPFTWYSQLASNQLGYVPSPDCFQKSGGGYEMATSKFAPDTGTRVLQTLIGLMHQLTPEAAPKEETVGPVASTWAYNFEKK